jgi:hypothetical protein
MRFQESGEEEDDPFDIKLNDDFEVIVARAAPAPPPPFSQIGPTVRQGQSFTLKCKNAEKYKEISEMTLLPMGKFFSEDWHGGAGKVTLALEKIDEGSYKAQVPYTAATGVVFVKLDGDTVGKMVVVFNPYQKGSLVYLKDKKERQEYVLNTKGRLYYGNAGRRAGLYTSIGSMDWAYHQDDKIVQKVVLMLLGDLDPEKRSDPRAVGRHFTRALSSSYWADIGPKIINGVLQGRWNGKYDDGKRPTFWVGTRSIFTKYLQQDMEPVKYGQCWVFAAILTSTLRYLGIPSRPVSNFRSAHDTPSVHGHKRKRAIYDSVIVAEKESVWNFHVWVDAWIKRDDITPETGYGWNALDATPQEKSFGEYQMGPAFVPYVKQHKEIRNEKNYDADFVLGEVNSIHRYPNRDDRSDIGRCMITKQLYPSNTGKDIIKEYKMCPSAFYEVVDGKCGFYTGDGKFSLTYGTKGERSVVEALDYNGRMGVFKVVPLLVHSRSKVKVNLNGRAEIVRMKDLSAGAKREASQDSSSSDSLLELNDAKEEGDGDSDNQETKETGAKKKKTGLIGNVRNLVRKGIRKIRTMFTGSVSRANKGFHGLKMLIRTTRKRAHLCKDCFSISQRKGGPLFVNEPLALQIHRKGHHVTKGQDFVGTLYFEIVANNGFNVEGGTFHREKNIKLLKGKENTEITIDTEEFQDHLSKALSLRVSLRVLSSDGKLVDYDEEQLQLQVPPLDVKVTSMNVPAAISAGAKQLNILFVNPLSIRLTNCGVSLDEEFGDREAAGFVMAINAGESSTIPISVPAGTGEDCAILSFECDQIFGLGWSKEVCWGKRKAGSHDGVVSSEEL